MIMLNRRLSRRPLVAYLSLCLLVGVSCPAWAEDLEVSRKPVLDGPGWMICTMPNLGELQGPVPRKQQIVDHGFVQAENGKWQLWACLRGTAVSRLIYGWEGDSLEAGPWKPRGVQVRADSRYGESIRNGQETAGAPFFFHRNGKYYCLFHSDGFRLLESDDGVEYARVEQQPGSSATGIPGGRVMVLKHQDTWYSYATLTVGKSSHVVAGSSQDFVHWTPGIIVSQGGRGGSGSVDAESPFVVFLDGYFYLFRASSISYKTFVYRSRDPLAFGIDDDSKLIAEFQIKAPELIYHQGNWYISDLHDFQGIRLARLKWPEDK